MSQKPISKSLQIENRLNREAVITVLTLLGNFQDEQVQGVLIGEIFNSDQAISIAAIKSAAQPGAEIVESHLHHIIERGANQQKIEAIRSIASIAPTASVDILVKYYNVISEKSVRREIIRTLNAIAPTEPTVFELNKSLLLSATKETDDLDVIMKGLLEAGETPVVLSKIHLAQPESQTKLFSSILGSTGKGISNFVQLLMIEAPHFAPEVLGSYLATYELKSEMPKQSFILDLLQKSDKTATASFIETVKNFAEKISDPGRMFKVLLRIPYVSLDIESLNGNLIVKIIEQVQNKSPKDLKEYEFTVNAHTEEIYSTLEQQYISLAGIEDQEELRIQVLAKILEQYATPSLLKKVQDFFKAGNKLYLESILKMVRTTLQAVSKEVIFRFKKCVPLFQSKDPVIRTKVRKALLRVNPENRNLLRRMNRIIRAIGTLKTKKAGKRVLDILKFAREEQIEYLEQTCVFTLCQLMNRNAIEEAKRILRSSQSHISSLNGYIRGSRYLPPKLTIDLLMKRLFASETKLHSRLLIADTINHMDLSETESVLPSLLKALKHPKFNEKLKKDIADAVSRHSDSTYFQPMIELTHGDDPVEKRLGIKLLKQLSLQHDKIPKDVLINRFYRLLEDPTREVKIETLLALLSLKDAESARFLTDHLLSDDIKSITQIISSAESFASKKTIPVLFKVLQHENKAVHSMFLQTMQPICLGPLSEKIRTQLLEYFGLRTERTDEPQSAAEEERTSLTTLIGQAKQEFLFKRQHSRFLTVFFIDIVSYTEKSASTDSSVIIRVIQDFENISIPSIRSFQGTIIKQMGDGILATFKHALNAAVTAVTIQEKIDEYNRFKTPEEKFVVRIGLNTGDVIRKNEDIFGDTVNTASRIETAAEPGETLLAQQTHEDVRDFIQCEARGDIKVKGKAGTISVYSAKAIKPELKKVLSRQGGTFGEEKSGEGTALANLRESFFKPLFDVPDQSEIPPELAERLNAFFKETSSAIENIARDYHEEYIFKRFLKKKWDEIMNYSKEKKVNLDNVINS